MDHDILAMLKEVTKNKVADDSSICRKDAPK